MRRHALLISVASIGVHVIALVAITSISITPDEKEPEGDLLRVPTAIELVSPAIDVALIPLESSPAAETNDDDAAAPAGASGTRLAMSSSGAHASSGGEQVPGNEPGPPREPSGYFKMRGLRHDLSIPQVILDRIAVEPVLPPEIPTPHDQRMKATGGGNYKIYDRVTTVTIRKDGSAHFKDEKDIDIHVAKPWRWITSFSAKKLARDIGNGLADWYEDPYRQTQAGMTADTSEVALAVEGGCSVWDAPGCETDRPQPKKHGDDDDGERHPSGGGIPLLGGKLAIDDYLHRKFVGDPYAARKLKLLDSTRDERAQIGAAHRAEQLYRSGEFVTRNLEAAWRSTSDPVARKEAVFALWDDCSEEAETKQGEAGATARGVVLGWINAKLPKGSPGAFTDAEIAAFDAKRTSKQHFAPYAHSN